MQTMCLFVAQKNPCRKEATRVLKKTSKNLFGGFFFAVIMFFTATFAVRPTAFSFSRSA